MSFSVNKNRKGPKWLGLLFDTEVLATKLDTIVSTITVLHVLAFYIRQNKGKDNYNVLHEDLHSYPIPAGDHMT